LNKLSLFIINIVVLYYMECSEFRVNHGERWDDDILIFDALARKCPRIGSFIQLRTNFNWRK
jgi:hypothetical protein